MKNGDILFSNNVPIGIYYNDDIIYSGCYRVPVQRSVWDKLVRLLRRYKA